jgi:phospholipase C
MPSFTSRSRLAGGGAAVLAAAVVAGVSGVGSGVASAAPPSPTTPIQHVVVIYQENISFDHYFGTYPNATNTSGQTFNAMNGTPTPNGLSGALLSSNPNGVNPRRYDPSNINDVLTCDQDHNYPDEQKAFDNGKMDNFPTAVGTKTGKSPTGQACQAGDVMNYYDGNTATAMWNYAQHFAMNDNSFSTTFGPSSPGAINLVSGDTGGVDTTRVTSGALPTPPATTSGDVAGVGDGKYSLIGDAQPYFDDCTTRDAVALTGKNIGDLLNAQGLSWGFFEGGFRADTPYSGPADGPATYNPTTVTGRAACTATHNVGAALGGTGATGTSAWGTKADYIPHHEPFQYYPSTANPHHIAPASLSAIGTDTATPGKFDTANHNYDMSDFDSLVSAIGHGTVSADHLPALSILKAPGYEDGHAAYSDPIDEQVFITKEINALEQLPTWQSTAVVIAYDDSDGWYDHVYSGVTNPSQTTADFLTGTNQCGAGPGVNGDQGRCGYGPRQPFMVISPFAKANDIDHTFTDQSSIIKFVEDNWNLGRIPGSMDTKAGDMTGMFNFSSGKGSNPVLFLDPLTGQPTSQPNPVVPESRFPVLLTVSGLVVLVAGAGFGVHRMRRRASA